MIAQQGALISELQQATKYTGFTSAGLVGNCSHAGTSNIGLGFNYLSLVLHTSTQEWWTVVVCVTEPHEFFTDIRGRGGASNIYASTQEWTPPIDKWWIFWNVHCAVKFVYFNSRLKHETIAGFWTKVSVDWSETWCWLEPYLQCVCRSIHSPLSGNLVIQPDLKSGKGRLPIKQTLTLTL